ASACSRPPPPMTRIRITCSVVCVIVFGWACRTRRYAVLTSRHETMSWRGVRRVVAVAGVLCLAGGLAACGKPAHRMPPAFTLQLANGQKVASHSLRGKTVVLSFWATWCGPCREELPALQKVYRKHYAD